MPGAPAWDDTAGEVGRRRAKLVAIAAEPTTVRIDQWLHAVRLTTTRSDAAAACKGGHVTINGQDVKPATTVQVGDRIEARLGRRDRIVVVTRLISKRVGPQPAAECYVDHSPPPPERTPAPLFAVRDRGAGRPTKRDRRKIDRLRGRRD